MADGDLGALGQAYVEVRADLKSLARDLEQGKTQTAQAARQMGEAFRSARGPARELSEEAKRFSAEARNARLTANFLRDAIVEMGGASALTEKQIQSSIRILREGATAWEALGEKGKAGARQLRDTIKELEQQQQNINKTFKEGGKENQGFAASFGPLTKAIGAYLSVTAITGAVTKTLEYADAIQHASARTGIAVERYQSLSYAARQNNVDIRELTSALNTFQDRAAGGDKSVAAGLATINLRWEELRKLDPADQLLKISDGIKQVGSHEERIKVVNDLFGRQGNELLPLLVSNMRDLEEQARRTGQVMSEDAVRGLSQAKNALEDTTTAVKNLFGELLALTNAPWVINVVTRFVGGLGTAAGAIRPGLSSVSSLPWGAPLVPLDQAPGRSFEDEVRRQRLIHGPGLGDIDLTGPSVASPAGIFASPFISSSLNPADPDAFKQLMAIDAQLERTGRARLQVLLEQERAAARQAKLFAEIRAMEMGRISGPHVPGIGVPVRGWSPDMELPGLAWTLLMQQQGQAAMARGRPPAAVLPSGMPIGTMVDPAVVMAFSDPTRAGAFQRGAFVPTFGRSLAQDLPGVILQTAMGGGSLSRSLGILGGQSLASSLMGNLGKEVGGKVVGGMLGQVMSGIIPGVGGLIGMGIGKLFGSIFGKGEQIEVNRTREQFVQAMGGLDALNKRAHEVGLTLDGFLRADSMEEYRREVDKLTEAFRKQEEQIQRNVTRLGELTETGAPLTRADLDMIRQIKPGTPEADALLQFQQASIGRAQTALQGLASSPLDFSAAGARGIGAGVAAVFGELQAQGRTPLEIVRELGPTIASLQERFKELGVSGGAAFREINAQVRFLSDENVAAAVTGIQQVTQLMVGLHNTGTLNTETFKDLTSQVTEWHTGLVEGGADRERALQAIQPYLQQIWELQQDFNYEVDEGTQELLDEALAAGYVGDQWRSTEDRLIASIDRLVRRFEEFFLGIVDHAEDAAADTQRAFDEITPPRFVPSDFYHGGGDYPTTTTGYGSRGGLVTMAGIRYLAAGGPAAVPGMPRGSDRIPAWLTPGEGVLSREGMAALGELNRGINLLERLANVPLPGAGLNPVLTADAIARALRDLGVGGLVINNDIDVEGAGFGLDLEPWLERTMLPAIIRVLQNNGALRRGMTNTLGVSA